MIVKVEMLNYPSIL